MKFRKILIANRGEIVSRIIRAAFDLGISTATVYAEADREALWLKESNESWSLGDGSMADSYLNIDKIIRVAKHINADAIHPGYGFLSENHEFAEACKNHHLIFIGPSSTVLKIAGNKLASHELARNQGIDVFHKTTGSVSELLTLKAKLVYPVLIKASAGGGGKGMRLVKDPEELGHALISTSNEAYHYFGDNSIFIEEYLPGARHIEVQILVDHYGNVVHLFERECSVQRRHQKVIEEAPAVAISESLRNKITQASVRMAKAAHYFNAGTFEFLTNERGEFYFLEINPRIQVEHGITEMITGIDIVKEQILIAEGNKLAFSQSDIKKSGHAIEARIYAENITNNLLPSPGTISFFHFPKLPEVRIDTAITEGDEIIDSYDPLIAKILVKEVTRDKAVEKMQEVLKYFKISGIHHNMMLIDTILKDDQYRHNQISTEYLENRLPEFIEQIDGIQKSVPHEILMMAAVIMILNRNQLNSISSPWLSGYWRNVKQIRFRKGSEIIELDYSVRNNNCIDFIIDNKIYKATDPIIDKNSVSFSIQGETKWFYLVSERNGIVELSDGKVNYNIQRFIHYDQSFVSTKEETVTGNGNRILAPLPGTVTNINVSEGQEIQRGDLLLTIESMKLENTLLAASAGLIKKIVIKAGDKVKKDDPVIYLQTISN